MIDYTKSIIAIKNGGYATDPVYITTITSIIRKCNLTHNLTQYDSCMAAAGTGTVKNPYKEPSVNICRGSSGPVVSWIQYALCRKGYTVAIDGIFGRKIWKLSKRFRGITT